jgi:Cu/Ag efflux pump CusA
MLFAPSKRLLFVTAALTLTAGSVFLYAQTEPALLVRPRAPMELMGIGPEMFQDRGVAWVRAFSEVVKAAIAELGVIVAAALLLIQNIRNSRTIEETKAHIEQRLDNQAKRINDVAIAATPGAAPIIPVDEPMVVTPA